MNLKNVREYKSMWDVLRVTVWAIRKGWENNIS
jgi:hypothetical protein